MSRPGRCSASQEREDFSIDRKRLVVEQPPRTANFTRDGFKITKAPPLMLEAFQSFFEITKYNYSREVRRNGYSAVGASSC